MFKKSLKFFYLLGLTVLVFFVNFFHKGNTEIKDSQDTALSGLQDSSSVAYADVGGYGPGPFDAGSCGSCPDPGPDPGPC